MNTIPMRARSHRARERLMRLAPSTEARVSIYDDAIYLVPTEHVDAARKIPGVCRARMKPGVTYRKPWKMSDR